MSAYSLLLVRGTYSISELCWCSSQLPDSLNSYHMMVLCVCVCVPVSVCLCVCVCVSVCLWMHVYMCIGILLFQVVLCITSMYWTMEVTEAIQKKGGLQVR